MIVGLVIILALGGVLVLIWAYQKATTIYNWVMKLVVYGIIGFFLMAVGAAAMFAAIRDGYIDPSPIIDLVVLVW
jgi:hypothetical protein